MVYNTEHPLPGGSLTISWRERKDWSSLHRKQGDPCGLSSPFIWTRSHETGVQAELMSSSYSGESSKQDAVVGGEAGQSARRGRPVLLGFWRQMGCGAWAGKWYWYKKEHTRALSLSLSLTHTHTHTHAGWEQKTKPWEVWWKRAKLWQEPN